MNTIYFTSDQHFSHRNVLKYCNRPFSTIEEHDETLIANWNKTVGPNDTIYFLGDLCLGNPEQFYKYINKLNGNIKFLFGNHDKGAREIQRRINYRDNNKLPKLEFLGDYAKIRFDNQKIILTHYAFRVWDGSHRGTWNLYGHSHGNLPDDKHSLSIDVGVDCHNYTPIDFYQVKEIMSKKNFKPVDHHGE